MRRIVRAVAVLIAAIFALMAAPALADPVVLKATLGGAALPAGGDPDGKGSFQVEVDPELGDFCYVLTVSGTGRVLGAVLGSNAADAKPGVVVSIETTGAETDMCRAVEPEVLKPIAANPGGYHVTVQTADHPDGALRGTLTKE